VHDELVFEVAEAEVPSALAIVKRVMEGAALPVIKLAVPIHVDAKAADNWEAAH
jgi:DNA polymerase-1